MNQFVIGVGYTEIYLVAIAKLFIASNHMFVYVLNSLFDTKYYLKNSSLLDEELHQ